MEHFLKCRSICDLTPCVNGLGRDSALKMSTRPSTVDKGGCMSTLVAFHGHSEVVGIDQALGGARGYQRCLHKATVLRQ